MKKHKKHNYVSYQDILDNVTDRTVRDSFIQYNSVLDMFKCSICSLYFKEHEQAMKHIESIHNPDKYVKLIEMYETRKKAVILDYLEDAIKDLNFEYSNMNADIYNSQQTVNNSYSRQYGNFSTSAINSGFTHASIMYSEKIAYVEGRKSVYESFCKNDIIDNPQSCINWYNHLYESVEYELTEVNQIDAVSTIMAKSRALGARKELIDSAIYKYYMLSKNIVELQQEQKELTDKKIEYTL